MKRSLVVFVALGLLLGCASEDFSSEYDAVVIEISQLEAELNNLNDEIDLLTNRKASQESDLNLASEKFDKTHPELLAKQAIVVPLRNDDLKLDLWIEERRETARVLEVQISNYISQADQYVGELADLKAGDFSNG